MEAELLLERGLQILFFVTVIAFVIYSIFLIYHWNEYGSSKKTTRAATLIYLFIAIALFAVMGVSIF